MYSLILNFEKFNCWNFIRKERKTKMSDYKAVSEEAISNYSVLMTIDECKFIKETYKILSKYFKNERS